MTLVRAELYLLMFVRVFVHYTDAYVGFYYLCESSRYATFASQTSLLLRCGKNFLCGFTVWFPV